MFITIHEDVMQEALKIINEARDCRDIKTDLNDITTTLDTGSDIDALVLDNKMREKYKEINSLQHVINNLPVYPSNCTRSTVNESLFKARLREDYHGIICIVAVKKGIKSDFRECLHCESDQF